MNAAQSHIVDTPLPVVQDYKALHELGLQYIHELSGQSWTNLNPSDPGVTILDQVCYALTELGYCIDFPVEDLLTDHEGNLKLKDQFYLPQEILTTAPIIGSDYEVFIRERYPVIRKVIVKPCSWNISLSRGFLSVWLGISTTSASVRSTLVRKSQHALDQVRDLGSCFFHFEAPAPLIGSASGRVVLSQRIDLSEVGRKLQEASDALLFTENQAGKPSAGELAACWLALDFIAEVPDLTLDFERETAPPSEERGWFLIPISERIMEGKLIFYFQKERLETHSGLQQDSIDFAPLPQPKPDPEESVPEGHFRDISDYYSIQYTFPEIYAVGPNSLDENAPAWKLAQSRQLKGYLTLFDQVLANEFAQLANIGSLFSFRNPITASPEDRKAFFANKDENDPQANRFPAPFLDFSPTYFFQSLYEVPHIRDLLIGNEAYDFGNSHLSDRQRESRSWDAYQDDPYNRYIRGMADMMETYPEKLARRNALLDHLLARHGESPKLINALIDGSVYNRNREQDRVIYKSLFLQNLAGLGYQRTKGYQFRTALKIPLPRSRPEEKNEEMPSSSPYPDGLTSYTLDSIFDTDRVDALQRIKERDYVDYSAFELKMHLLLGLQFAYLDFIEANAGSRKKQVELARWMITARKGCIMVEDILLLKSASYILIIKTGGEHWRTEKALSVKTISQVADQLGTMQTIKGGIKVGKEEIAFQKIEDSMAIGESAFESLGKWECAVAPVWDYNEEQIVVPGIRASTIDIFLPAFIPVLNTPEFKERLRLFIDYNLPLHLNCRFHFLDTETDPDLWTFATQFAFWHNGLSLAKSDLKDLREIPLKESTFRMAGLLQKILGGQS